MRLINWLSAAARPLVATTLGLAAAGAHANLLTNGGFENTAGTYLGNGSGYMRVDAPSAVIPGWTVVSNNLAWTNAINPFGLTPSEGSFSLDMTGESDNGTFAGIAQTFTTVAGASYRISLDLGVNNSCGLGIDCTGPASVNIQINGISIQNMQSFDPTTSGQSWKTIGVDFIAPTGLTALRIDGSQAGQYYLGLDNVAVTAVAAVPEPEAYALMLAGLGVIGCVARARNRRRG